MIFFELGELVVAQDDVDAVREVDLQLGHALEDAEGDVAVDEAELDVVHHLLDHEVPVEEGLEFGDLDDPRHVVLVAVEIPGEERLAPGGQLDHGPRPVGIVEVEPGRLLHQGLGLGQLGGLAKTPGLRPALDLGFLLAGRGPLHRFSRHGFPIGGPPRGGASPAPLPRSAVPSGWPWAQHFSLDRVRASASEGRTSSSGHTSASLRIFSTASGSSATTRG
jgi:hypothetical protein